MGVEIREGPEWLESFYALHVSHMRELGSPAHSLRFFSSIMSNLSDRVKLYVAAVGDEVIGGKLVCLHRKTMYFLWVSSPSRYRRYAAISRLDWHAIEDAMERGFSRCDFGRSTVNSSQYEFKRKWGAEKKQLHWYVYPENSHAPGAAGDIKREAFRKVWRRLPTGVAGFLGPRLRGGLPQ